MRLIDADELLKIIPPEETCSRFAVTNAPTIVLHEPQRWIPCSERLPEESGLYIVTEIGHWVHPVGTRYYNVREDGGFWSGHPSDKVLAWMPLPAPYREEGDE